MKYLIYLTKSFIPDSYTSLLSVPSMTLSMYVYDKLYKIAKVNIRRTILDTCIKCYF